MAEIAHNGTQGQIKISNSHSQNASTGHSKRLLGGHMSPRRIPDSPARKTYHAA
jgi:hypothetical protein